MVMSPQYFLGVMLVIAMTAIQSNCQLQPPTDPTLSPSQIAKLGALCRWSPCEGVRISSQAVCNKYSLGGHTGRTASNNCNWNANSIECCRYLTVEERLNMECKLTNGCYDVTNDGPSYACFKDLGRIWMPTGESASCKGTVMNRYMCCKDK